MYFFSLKKMVPLRKTQFAMMPKNLWNRIWILYNQRGIFLYFLNSNSTPEKIVLLQKKGWNGAETFMISHLNSYNLHIKFYTYSGVDLKQLRIEKLQNNLPCKLYRIQMGLYNNFGPIIFCAFLARFFFANLLKKSHIFSYTTWAMRSSENGSCIQYVAQSSLASMPDT